MAPRSVVRKTSVQEMIVIRAAGEGLPETAAPAGTEGFCICTLFSLSAPPHTFLGGIA